MDISDALPFIEALACGVDPISGDALPDDSPLHHPQVIRALFTATRLMESIDDGAPTSAVDSRPVRVGEPWNGEEDHKLIHAFEAGESFSQIAKAHQRSRGAIVSRLVRLGRLLRKSDASSRRKSSSQNSERTDEKWWRKERPQAGKRWSEDEDAELKKHAATGMTIQEMAQRLGRGNHAVEVRRFKLDMLSEAQR